MNNQERLDKDTTRMQRMSEHTGLSVETIKRAQDAGVRNLVAMAEADGMDGQEVLESWERKYGRSISL